MSQVTEARLHPDVLRGDWHQLNLRYLELERERLQRRIARQVRWLRHGWDALDPERDRVRSATLVPDAEADRLLASGAWSARFEFLARDPESQRLYHDAQRLDEELAHLRMASLESGRPLPLDNLARLFHLDTFERDTLLLCLAAELWPEMRRLVAYVHDDPGALRPTPALALALLVETPDALPSALHSFAAAAPLRYFALLAEADGARAHGETGLLRPLRLPERVVTYLEGFDRPDPLVSRCLRRVGPLPLGSRHQAQLERLVAWAGPRIEAGDALRLSLTGPARSGRSALAQGLAQRLDLALHRLDLRQAASAPGLLPILARESVLRQTALYVDLSDALSRGEEGTTHADGQAIDLLSSLVRSLPMPLVIAGQRPLAATLGGAESALGVLSVPVCPGDSSDELEHWRQVFDTGELSRLERLPELVEQFRLGPAGIEAASEQARLLAELRSPVEPRLTDDDVWRACHEQTEADLTGLAQRIEPRHRWQDLVLPDDPMCQLRELAAQVGQRSRVYQEWGFGEKLARGRGISALFAGPSGTGKTTAAEILANELDLPLYRIDLSGVVSKYIGETEKNLRRVFDGAERSGAILFFDEADALFGKRSEVKDSHDRYANIEVSYLLQRMEDYRGLAILATNMKSHLDQAFSRRLRFLIDFPFPDAAQRRRIWQSVFPHQARLGELDFEALSRLEITGGNIKNIAVNAAFLAADSGTAIGMEHILAAARREYSKLEKLRFELDALQVSRPRRSSHE